MISLSRTLLYLQIVMAESDELENEENKITYLWRNISIKL